MYNIFPVNCRHYTIFAKISQYTTPSIYAIEPGTKALVPNLGVNYQNWAMGPFALGNGLLFILVF